ncbi:MAG: hypothetical protein V2I53_02195 [Paracoccaceae bacterium]|nr:hypothetical protein [Paracoccaceae bacterium]
MRLTLAMSSDAITDACQACLTGVHAVDLATCIDHPAEDVDVIWLADGTAVLTIRLWQEVEPPFRHAVAVMSLEFDTGAVCAITNVTRRSFGA